MCDVVFSCCICMSNQKCEHIFFYLLVLCVLHSTIHHLRRLRNLCFNLRRFLGKLWFSSMVGKNVVQRHLAIPHKMWPVVLKSSWRSYKKTIQTIFQWTMRTIQQCMQYYPAVGFGCGTNAHLHNYVSLVDNWCITSWYQLEWRAKEEKYWTHQNAM